MLNRNVIFPSIIILFSAVAFAVVTQFDKPMYQDASVDAKFFPMLIVLAQIVICIVLIIQYKYKQSHSKEKSLASKEEPIISKMSLFGVAFLIGYVLLISVIGYLYSSLAAFIFYLVYFKIKKPLYYIVAVIFVFAVYYLFGEVFYVSLPQAMWS